MTLSYEEAWNARPDGRSREEIFRSIKEKIRQNAEDDLSDAQVHEAACRLIAFCREWVGLKQGETIGFLDSITPYATPDNTGADHEGGAS